MRCISSIIDEVAYPGKITQCYEEVATETQKYKDAKEKSEKPQFQKMRDKFICVYPCSSAVNFWILEENK